MTYNLFDGTLNLTQPQLTAIYYCLFHMLDKYCQLTVTNGDCMAYRCTA